MRKKATEMVTISLTMFKNEHENVKLPIGIFK